MLLSSSSSLKQKSVRKKRKRKSSKNNDHFNNKHRNNLNDISPTIEHNDLNPHNSLPLPLIEEENETTANDSSTFSIFPQKRRKIINQAYVETKIDDDDDDDDDDEDDDDNDDYDSNPKKFPCHTVEDPRIIYFKTLINITPEEVPLSQFSSINLKQSPEMDKFKEYHYPYDFNILYKVIFCSNECILIRNSIQKPLENRNEEEETSDDRIQSIWEIIKPGLSVEQIICKLSLSRIIISLPLLKEEEEEEEENNRKWHTSEWKNWKPNKEIIWFINIVFPFISKRKPSLSQIKLTALIHKKSYSDFYTALIKYTKHKIETVSRQQQQQPQQQQHKDGMIIVISKNNTLGNPLGVYLCFNNIERMQIGLQRGKMPHLSIKKNNISKLRYISPFGCRKLIEIDPYMVLNNKTCVYIYIPVSINIDISRDNNTLKQTYIKNFDKLLNMLIHMERLGDIPGVCAIELNQHINNNLRNYTMLTPNNCSTTTTTTMATNRHIMQNHATDNNNNHISYSPSRNACINIHYNSLLWFFGGGAEMDAIIILKSILSPLIINNDDNANDEDKNINEHFQQSTNEQQQQQQHNITGGKLKNTDLIYNICYLNIVKYLTTWYLYGKFEWVLTNHRLYFKRNNDRSIDWYVYDGYETIILPHKLYHKSFKDEYTIIRSEILNNESWPLTKLSTISNNHFSPYSKKHSILSCISPYTKSSSKVIKIQLSNHWLVRMLNILIDDNRKRFFLDDHQSLSKSIINLNNDAFNYKKNDNNKNHSWDFWNDDDDDDDNEYEQQCNNSTDHNDSAQYLFIKDQLLTEISKLSINLLKSSKHPPPPPNTHHNSSIKSVQNHINDFISSQLKSPQFTHPFFIQMGIFIISHYLNKSFRCCWFPNTPTTLMKLYNRQNYEGLQPKERVYLMAIDNEKEKGMYWVVKFRWYYNNKISIYPTSTEIYLLYNSNHPYSKKIEKITPNYLETEILPHIVFFVWPNLLE